MKSGMGKFTKGCLITALVTFIIGFLICGVGALLGGFRMLDGMDIQGITGIPFHYHRYDNGGIEYGFGWDDDWDNDVDWSEYAGWNSINEGEGEVELELTADTLHDLIVELGACELHIEESKDDHVRIGISGDRKYFRYQVEDGDSLLMAHRTGRGFWNWSRGKIAVATKVYLYLPEGTAPNYVEIKIGAGSMESVGLQAHEMEMEVGAGACKINGLTSADAIDLMVGAGRIDIESLKAGELDMEVGAGELYIEDADINREADLELGMGNAELSGLFRGSMNIDCGMGNVTLHLDDAEEDHNYEIDCSMGSVNVGDHSYSGVSADGVMISNGSGSTYEIECSMGHVNIDFAQ